MSGDKHTSNFSPSLAGMLQYGPEVKVQYNGAPNSASNALGSFPLSYLANLVRLRVYHNRLVKSKNIDTKTRINENLDATVGYWNPMAALEFRSTLAILELARANRFPLRGVALLTAKAFNAVAKTGNVVLSAALAIPFSIFGGISYALLGKEHRLTQELLAPFGTVKRLTYDKIAQTYRVGEKLDNQGSLLVLAVTFAVLLLVVELALAAASVSILTYGFIMAFAIPAAFFCAKECADTALEHKMANHTAPTSTRDDDTKKSTPQQQNTHRIPAAVVLLSLLAVTAVILAATNEFGIFSELFDNSSPSTDDPLTFGYNGLSSASSTPVSVPTPTFTFKP